MNKRSFIVVFLSVWCSLIAYTQSPYFHYFEDSIKPGFRISGSLDSTDVYCSPFASNNLQFFQPSLRITSFDQFSALPRVVVPRRFSALPHIGFSYSMGSNIQQLGKISYTQSIDSSNFLQMDYQRQLSNGSMRNQEFQRNQFELSWLRRGKIHALDFDVKFLNLNQGLNGGLLGDSLQSDFAQIFQEVKKTNASQKYTVASIKLDNYFSFIANDDLKTGFFLNPFFKITNRRYNETDTLAQIYGFTNYHADSTTDFWQKGEVGASGGYFFHTEQFAANAGIQARYWDYDNALVHNDTLELAVVGDLIIDLKSGWEWKNSARINVLGALGEFNTVSALTKSFENVSINLNGSAGRRYPQNYQRAYYGNTVQYSWSDKVQETFVDAKGTVKLKLGKQSVSAFGGIQQRFNMPLFLDGRWRQDTITSLSLASVGGGFDLSWGKFLFQPKATFQFASVSVVPTAIIQARIAYNGTVFKGKRLRNVTGIDLGFATGYRLMTYIPMMDTYSFNSGSANFEAMPKIHFFTQFDLGFFRWFVRVENIEQTFLKAKNQESLGYPVLPLQVRFGVSWDLFN